MCACVRVRASVCVRMRVRVYVCLCRYVYMYIYIYSYIELFVQEMPFNGSHYFGGNTFKCLVLVGDNYISYLHTL